MYGAALAKEIKNNHPETSIYGIGGEKLKKEADFFLIETVHNSAIGLWEELKQCTFFHNFKKSISSFLKKTDINKVVIVDFPQYNFKVAELIRKFNIPVTTFITPHFWMWKDTKKAEKLIRYSDNIITIFKPEYDFYKTLTSKVFFFGHPLTEILNTSESNYVRKNRNIITLFPGSRKQEIKQLLPAMLDTVSLLHSKSKHYKFFIVPSSRSFIPLITKTLHSKKIDFINIRDKDKESLLHKTSIIICATGSTNLEAVLYKIPVITLGRLSWISYLTAKYYLKINIKFFSLPNILARKIVVPEFIQKDINYTRIAETAEFLLKPDNYNNLISKYNKLHKLIFKNKKPFKNICNIIINS